MTDTTEPPKRPRPPRARPPGADNRSERPRARASGGRPPLGGERRGGDATSRGDEPAPARDDARIAKVMARAGLCSRRDAEGWIAAGRVAINGAVIDSPALNVKPGDRITVDGELLPERERTRLFLFHKPRGLVTTARDPEGRPTIFDTLPEGLPRVVSVGRLDINTEGLMLLTNDGGLARVLELPATGWLRRYRVRANGSVDQARLDGLKGGVTLDGVDYAGIDATLDRVQGANVWLTMGLREGKNREIKRVLESLGLAVTRLIRVSFGPFQLGELPEGGVEIVPNRVLREQLGPGLAAAAGVDLDGGEEAPARRPPRGGDGAAPPRPGRGEPSAPRPHVGAMRAARAEAAAGARKRVERGATADRRGRAVEVERVIPADAGPAPRRETRNARRFAAEAAPTRQRTRSDAAAPRRGAFKPRPGDDPRPGSPARRDGDARPARRFDRKDGDAAPARRFDRKDGDAAPARRFEARDGDTRPARRFDRKDGDAAPARRFEPREGDARPARRFEPREGRGEAGEARPPGRGAPERPRSGKPGGFGSGRPVTGRNKRDGGFKGARPPSGDGPNKPRGGKPPGGRAPRGRP